jgi:hypothetical protein
MTIIGVANLTEDQRWALGDIAGKFKGMPGGKRSRAADGFVSDALQVVRSMVDMYPRMRGKKSETISDFGDRIASLLTIWDEQLQEYVREGSYVYIVFRGSTSRSSTDYLTPYWMIGDELEMANRAYSAATGIESVDVNGSWAYRFDGSGYSKPYELVSAISTVLFGSPNALRARSL